MAASTCTADIESAGEDLADVTTKVMSAIEVCSTADKAKCAETISEVVKELAVASKDVEEAVTDCGGTSTKCAQDISDAATELAQASEDVSKAADDCASSANSGCTSDITAAFQDLGKTGVDITTSIKECKTSTLTAIPQKELTASTCTADIESAGEDLADATTKILSAIKVCSGSDKTKCVEAVSEVVDELGVASKDIEEAVTDCGGTSTKCA